MYPHNAILLLLLLMLLLQSCPTLCDPIDGSPPGSPVPGILQARTLEWVITFKVPVNQKVYVPALMELIQQTGIRWCEEEIHSSSKQIMLRSAIISCLFTILS